VGAASAILTGVSAAAQLGTSYSQYAAQKLQGEYSKKTAELNTQLANMKAADAERLGEKAVSNQRRATRQLIGAQRASLAAQGIDLESGSALELQDDTKTLSELDVITIRNNAFRQAFGFKIEGIQANMAGTLARFSNDQAAINTLLTGAMKAGSTGAQGGYYGARNKDLALI
jgi:hypothetical protein